MNGYSKFPLFWESVLAGKSGTKFFPIINWEVDSAKSADSHFIWEDAYFTFLFDPRRYEVNSQN